MKVLLKINALLFAVFISLNSASQIPKTFYDTRIVNGQSTELNNEGVMKFIIAHRFGRINSGAYELFGLDQSTIRLGLDYGIKNWISVGLGRSSNEKTVDGFLKFRIMKQSTGEKAMPFSIVAFTNIAINGVRFQDTSRVNYFSSRLFYSYQVLVSRRVSDNISAQLMPSLVHRNLIPSNSVAHDVFAMGGAIRYKAYKRLTFSCEYYFVFPNQLDSSKNNSLAVGIDLETKGHVFQFHFGNSRGMTEKFFITETTGEWLDGDIHFGFNITRDFKIKGRKY